MGHPTKFYRAIYPNQWDKGKEKRHPLISNQKWPLFPPADFTERGTLSCGEEYQEDNLR